MAWCKNFVCSKKGTCLYVPQNEKDCQNRCSSRCEWCSMKLSCMEYKRTLYKRKGRKEYVDYGNSCN